MGGSLNAFKAAFPNLLTQIQTASSNDFRLGLITFKDNVTVVDDLGTATATVSAHVAALTASGGMNTPEASDQALNTAIHNIISRPNQVGSFSGIWRTGARKVIVLITDDLPGGFNDAYTGNALALAQANDANTLGIAIHAVYVPTSGTPNATTVGIMNDYANISRGHFRQTQPTGADVPKAVQDFMSGCRTPSDVYIRDYPADVGNEPSGAPFIWTSPDIKICNNVNGCATSGNPVYGSPNNYVFVTLRNHGPVRATGPISGSLYVYYLPSGGNSTWPGSWQLIKVEQGLYLTAGEDRDVRIQWNNVPVPGHYCLLARWVSQGDPMTFPELIGSNTVTNTLNNNNIAWRNVDVIRVLTGGTVGTTYDTRPTPGRVTDLVLKPTDKAFPGTVALDLGTVVFDLWKAAGSKSTGVKSVQGTTLVFGPDGGTVNGIKTDKPIDARLNLTFAAGGETGTFPVMLYEFDPAQKVDLGGVRYDVSVLSPDAQPVPVDLSAQRRDSLVELSWPHSVQHKAYRVFRSDSPERGTGEVIGELDAGDASETEALHFIIDASKTPGGGYYSVQSLSNSGAVFSEPVSADSTPN
jgi:hypothetical protein